ncbi:amidase signature enzyme [Fragilariopsis cylindrus CCMP1102]|uniref:Amidase signature enzyme n=1 Tax=Fragilariopsis cylindrus CCMP1102 TaxID=635003 RepID=A0A1E7FFV2_9STRA|nr:amidase signature enzyme [Fragilariopsis cylindrus CCMP1102]|eukprot:OEU17050.1 amidase signature enzyme [Fragilariopsis cylindrus CCMP1102]
MANQQQQREREQLPLPLPLHYESATTLADKIRRREVTSLELVELFIQRIIRYDNNSNDNDGSKSKTKNKNRSKTSINAVVVRCFDQARTRAKELDRLLLDTIKSIQIQIQKKKDDYDYDDGAKNSYSSFLLLLEEKLGPLHGVPITVKENNDVCGLQTTLGNPISINNIATTNSPAVQQLLNSGAIILGKTNVPLNCNDVQTYNSIYGTTSNPYNVECTPGGSSGGSAASLCIGFSALELGGDIGGSIRLPAALCGIYGHKPTLNAIPFSNGCTRTPDIVVKGPMSRSPYDLELALKVLVHIPDHSPMKRLQVQSDCRLPPCTKTKLNQFRIAIWDDDQTCCPVDSNIKSAIKLLVDKLKDVAECHHVYQDRPLTSKYGWKGGSKYAFEIYQQLLATEENLGIDPELIETARDILRKRKKRKKKDEENNDHLPTEKSTQQKLRDRVIQQTEWIIQSTQSWNVANNARQKMRTTYEKFFQEYDVLICPITASVAWPKDESSSGCHEWSTDRKTQLELIVGSSRMDEDDEDDDDDNNNNDFTKNVQHFWKIGQRIIPGANGHQTPYHDQVFWSGVTNICGNPSTVFPAGQAKVTAQEGTTNHHHIMMPIGLQVVGDAGASRSVTDAPASPLCNAPASPLSEFLHAE